ncbi:uncharacterized protein LOC106667993 [Cimex lectularius]|uniref:Uncharacterized protein n=1 Tax=Cimex lectularius TaxID=79782 RepID=A0A8I6RXZ0_CIMLE|nr:uncharacterized protein LOC106667993 [Cimex lectularius]
MQSHISLVCFACIVFVTFFVGSATTTPYLREKRQWDDIVDQCKIYDSTETTCQRCAKETKSVIVYPMCCEGRESAREWCTTFINYGITDDN